MKIERKRTEDLERRQGNTWRTLIMAVWLGITGFASYYISNIIFSSLFSFQQVRDGFVFPIIGLTSQRVQVIPDILIQISCILLVLIFMQTVLFIGYALGNPAGRRKSGMAHGHSKYKKEFMDH